MRLHRTSTLAMTLMLGVASLIGGCATTQRDHSAARDAYQQGMSLAVQGDLRSALLKLHRVDLDALDIDQRRTVRDILARFEQGGPLPAATDLDAWTTEVLATYRRYWTGVMLGDAGAADAETGLARALAPLAGADTSATPEMDAIEPLLQQRIEARGLHALFGVTTPLREFMLWRVQDDRDYTVALPEGAESVHVAMLDQFASLGWVGWATAERAHTGGWTTPERLFCVRSAYDLDSEAFRVSYLAHEGQHFADARRFPALEQPELEYRAKLVEIALAEQSLSDLLAGFASNQSDSREQPHAYANRRLMHDLQSTVVPWPRSSDVSAWRAVPSAEWHAAAVRLLFEDSRALREQAQKP